MANNYRPPNIKEKAGRPKVDIDWKKVDELLMAGCLGTGIAAYLGIAAYTLYERCEVDNGKSFSTYSQEKKEKGDEILRAHQFAKALGLTDKGDNSLLIWLGKTRLKQKEHEDQVITKEVEAKFDQLMKQMQANKDQDSSNASKIDETNINEESKS